jgi:hypothetical protein
MVVLVCVFEHVQWGSMGASFDGRPARGRGRCAPSALCSTALLASRQAYGTPSPSVGRRIPVQPGRGRDNVGRAPPCILP